MKRLLAAGVLALCLMTSQIARADENRNVKIKAEIAHNYLLWQEAFKIKDPERVISNESPDFTNVLEDGQVRSKKDTDALWRDTMKKIRKVHSASIAIKKLSIEPNRVVVVAKHNFDVDLERSDKVVERYVVVFQSRDIWVEYDRVWMLKRMEDLHTKLTINGEPVN